MLLVPYLLLSFGLHEATGKEWLRVNWKLCRPLNTSEDVMKLREWLTDVWGNLAMVDYPYPADFLAPLPAYPVKVR